MVETIASFDGLGMFALMVLAALACAAIGIVVRSVADSSGPGAYLIFLATLAVMGLALLAWADAGRTDRKPPGDPFAEYRGTR